MGAVNLRRFKPKTAVLANSNGALLPDPNLLATCPRRPKRQMSLVSFVRHSPAPKSAAPARPLASAKPAAFAHGWPAAGMKA